MPVIPVFRLVPLLHLLLSRIFTVGEKRGHFVVTKEATMKHRLFFALQVALLAMMGFWGPAHAQNPPLIWSQVGGRSRRSVPEQLQPLHLRDGRGGGAGQ